MHGEQKVKFNDTVFEHYLHMVHKIVSYAAVRLSHFEILKVANSTLIGNSNMLM
jgi:hypothetical protein